MIENAIDYYDKIPKCIPGSQNSTVSKCITIAYGVIGEKEDWISHSLDFLAISNDLDRATDIIEIDINQKPQEFNTFFENYQNVTQVGIIFCTSNYTITKDITFPCSNFDHVRGVGEDPFFRNKKLLVYTIFYNWTLFYRSPYISGKVGGNY